MDNNGQPSAVLHASVMSFSCSGANHNSEYEIREKYHQQMFLFECQNLYGNIHHSSFTETCKDDICTNPIKRMMKSEPFRQFHKDVDCNIDSRHLSFIRTTIFIIIFLTKVGPRGAVSKHYAWFLRGSQEGFPRGFNGRFSYPISPFRKCHDLEAPVPAMAP